MKKFFNKANGTKVTVENLHGNYPVYIDGEYFSSKCVWTSDETVTFEYEGKEYTTNRNYVNLYGKWYEVHHGPNYYTTDERHAIWNCK